MNKAIFTSSTEGDITRITVRGSNTIYFDSASDLLAEIRWCCVAQKPRELVLDLKGIARMDATALGSVAVGYTTAKASGVQLLVENATKHIHDLLRVTKLAQFVLPPVVALAGCVKESSGPGSA